MNRHRSYQHHPEIGSVALGMLWIPIVALIVVVGFLALRTPRDSAPTLAVSAAHATSPDALSRSPRQADAASSDVTNAVDDEATAAHVALDPVGAGHDVAR